MSDLRPRVWQGLKYNAPAKVYNAVDVPLVLIKRKIIHDYVTLNTSGIEAGSICNNNNSGDHETKILSI